MVKYQAVSTAATTSHSEETFLWGFYSCKIFLFVCLEEKVKDLKIYNRNICEEARLRSVEPCQSFCGPFVFVLPSLAKKKVWAAFLQYHMWPLEKSACRQRGGMLSSSYNVGHWMGKHPIFLKEKKIV